MNASTAEIQISSVVGGITVDVLCTPLSRLVKWE